MEKDVTEGLDIVLLTQDQATDEAALKALQKGNTSLWLHSGHGGRPEQLSGSEYLAMAGTGKIYPSQIANLCLPGTIVHLDCCMVGTVRGRGGGRFDGHPTAALLAGASCVLASVHPIWNSTALDFSERLYKRLLDPQQPMAVGEALLQTRREMARDYGNNPLVWATTVLWGNPWACVYESGEDEKG